MKEGKDGKHEGSGRNQREEGRREREKLTGGRRGGEFGAPVREGLKMCLIHHCKGDMQHM